MTKLNENIQNVENTKWDLTNKEEKIWKNINKTEMEERL
jgi:hypothetical protein